MLQYRPMPDVVTSLERPPSGRSSPIWFDAAAYCATRLGYGGYVPWTAPGDLGAYINKAQALFRSDAILLDLADVYERHLAVHPELLASMRAKTRPGYALRAMLADESVRRIAKDAATVYVASAKETPVVLALPSPSRWASAATAFAFATRSEPVTSTTAESAAMYVADALRGLAGSGISGILIDEGDTSATDILDAECYRAVFNVAANYGWNVSIRTAEIRSWPSGPVTGVTSWIGRAGAEFSNARWGLVVDARDWFAGNELPKLGGGPAYLRVPAEADATLVMECVKRCTAN